MMFHMISPKRVAIFALVVLLAAPAVASAEYPELSDARIAAIAQLLPSKPSGFGLSCSDRTAWVPIAQYYQGRSAHRQSAAGLGR